MFKANQRKTHKIFPLYLTISENNSQKSLSIPEMTVNIMKTILSAIIQQPSKLDFAVRCIFTHFKQLILNMQYIIQKYFIREPPTVILIRIKVIQFFYFLLFTNNPFIDARVNICRQAMDTYTYGLYVNYLLFFSSFRRYDK